MRRPRELQFGGRYHVSARANRKEMILDSSAMKDLFLEVVGRAKQKYDFHIENFCILGNHFHMIIKPLGNANLSRIMQWIMSVFAMAWNRRHGLTGHVWGERFFSRLLGTIQEFLQVFRYIDANPVKACLVKKPEDWRYGGLWHMKRYLHKVVEALPIWARLLFPGHGPLLLT